MLIGGFKSRLLEPASIRMSAECHHQTESSGLLIIRIVSSLKDYPFFMSMSTPILDGHDLCITIALHLLLFDSLNTIPASLEALLPQAHSVVTTTNG